MKGNGESCQKLYTDWGKNIDTDNVLSEYPRPLLKRDSYINLNGIWQYTFTSVNKNLINLMVTFLYHFHRKLLFQA